MQRILARIKTVGAARVVRTTSFQFESSIGLIMFSGSKSLNNSEQGKYKLQFRAMRQEFAWGLEGVLQRRDAENAEKGAENTLE